MIIVKIGGGKAINLKGIVADLAELNAKGEKFVIVHGANHARDELAKKLGMEKKTITSISGYGSVFSDESAIDLLMMSYAGLKNKRIVELCQQNGINAVGLSGIDGKLIQGKRNSGIRVEENGKKKLVRDFSGKPQGVNSGLLNLLMGNGYVPAISVPIIDETNTAINSENDDIVRVLQQELGAEKIISLIEEKGFLADRKDGNSVVRKISKEQLFQMEQKSEGRMKRKLLSIRQLFENGKAVVMISDGRTEHPIKDALDGKGTIIE